MALGKNLKTKKLISDEVEKPTLKKVKKKPISKEKELITKAKPAAKKKPVVKKKEVVKKKPVAKKKIVVKKKEVTEEKKVSTNKQEPIHTQDLALSRYIANELRQRKTLLREQYSQQIANVKDEILQFVSFEMGGETYAVDIDDVKEIVQKPKLSQTPNTPPHIKGVANVRDTNYVVFDLAVRFHVSNDLDQKYLLILDSDQIKSSLILPALPSTFKIGGKYISSEMSMIEDASLDLSYIKGIIQYQDKLIYYLDIVEMLKNDKAVVVPDKLVTKSI